MAKALEEAAAALAVVTTATASPVSGSLLVLYAPEADLGRLLADVRAEVEALTSVPLPSEDPGGSSLFGLLGVALPGWKELAGPVLLTVTARSLQILRGLSVITLVNAAGGDGPRLLRRLGVSTTSSQLNLLGAAGVVLTVTGAWVQQQRSTSWQRLAREVEHRIRSGAFTWLEAQDLAFFDEHGTGELLNTLTAQVDAIGELITASDQMIESVVTIVIAGTALLRAAPGLAIIAGAALPLVLAPAQLLGESSQRAFSRQAEDAAGLTQALENLLTGIVEVKSFTAESVEAERVDKLSGQLVRSTVAGASAGLLRSNVVQTTFFTGATAATWYGAQRLAAGRMPATEAVRSLYWLPQLMEAFGGAAQASGAFYSATAGARRLGRIFDSTPHIRSGTTPLPAARVRGDIVLDDVTFGYDPSAPVLTGVSLHIPAGQRLGIVGPNGSGKTTLLWLLLRFYEPDSGRILLDSEDLRNLDIRDLRSAIAFVSQDVYLFDDTIERNIRYGRPDASREDLTAALAAAGATGIVEAMPLGLDTKVGERGHRLSGGQRQRVALARAFLKGSPIFALDEATSHLDYEAEAAVKTSLKEATLGKTVILIAHRLSSVRDADNIVVLDGGRIREQGTHESLLAQEGIYHRLWQLQS